ncbi:hypothetical protein CYMTET_36415, partial [Cymbomonas tetramitiformis]
MSPPPSPMVRVAELSYEEEYEEPAPPPDYDPPVITLKGEPLEEILQNQEYIDPGMPSALASAPPLPHVLSTRGEDDHEKGGEPLRFQERAEHGMGVPAETPSPLLLGPFNFLLGPPHIPALLPPKPLTAS